MPINLSGLSGTAGGACTGSGGYIPICMPIGVMPMAIGAVGGWTWKVVAWVGFAPGTSVLSRNMRKQVVLLATSGMAGA